MFGPKIDGDKVVLGPVEEAHLPRFVEFLADPEVTRYMKTGPKTLEEEYEWFRKQQVAEEGIIWSVLDKESGLLIGNTGIRLQSRFHRAVSGIMIGDKRFWGRGYATEVMRLRTDYIFRELKLIKVMSEVCLENLASRRALEKNGYRVIGIAQRHMPKSGRFYDCWLLEILNPHLETR